jgi:hypothetical protein
LINALPSFVAAARNKGVDLRMGVTTTGIEPVSNACPGGAQGGEAGRLFPADRSNPRILTLATPNAETELQQNANVGQCAFVEKGFEAMRRALSPPLIDSADDPRTSLPNDGNLGMMRDSAALAVVFISDEDDHSPDSVDTYVRFAQSLKGASQPQRATLFAIAPTGPCATAGGTGNRYIEAAQRTGGEALSICAGDYVPLLQSVANKAFNPQDRFPLSTSPDPTSIKVLINGVEQSGGWSYDPAGNAVQFSSIPAPGARIEITYRKACSN